MIENLTATIGYFVCALQNSRVQSSEKNMSNVGACTAERMRKLKVMATGECAGMPLSTLPVLFASTSLPVKIQHAYLGTGTSWP